MQKVNRCRSSRDGVGTRRVPANAESAGHESRWVDWWPQEGPMGGAGVPASTMFFSPFRGLVPGGRAGGPSSWPAETGATFGWRLPWAKARGGCVAGPAAAIEPLRRGVDNCWGQGGVSTFASHPACAFEGALRARLDRVVLVTSLGPLIGYGRPPVMYRVPRG
jgi:hypothetical protein